MNVAQRIFIGTAWLFTVLSGLLFLVPTDISTAEEAAWFCLGTALFSHLVLLGAIVFDVLQSPGDVPLNSE